MKNRQMIGLYSSFFIILAFSVPAEGQLSEQAQRLETHVSMLAADSLLGRGFGTEQGVQAARYIAGQFEEAGIEPLQGSFFHPFYYRLGILNIDGVNVAGIIPGSDPVLKDEYIILGAHYDHVGWEISGGDTLIYNGADDNASGVASIIEIGRRLSREQGALGRSVILVAFDGEESGLIGSNRFLEDSIVDPSRIRMMCSLDMVGMYEAHGGVDLVGVKQVSDYESLIDTLAGTHGVAIRKANRTVGQRTDTAPFGEISVPAIHVSTGTESPYHKPEDEADLLDYEGMAKLTAFMSDVTLQMSSVETISALRGPVEGKTDTGQAGLIQPGIRVRVGSSHYDYSDRYYEGKPVFAAEAGLFTRIRATRFLSVQPEILYETKGSRYSTSNFRSHSVTTPLNLLFTTSAADYLESYFLVGGYYSYHFSGSLGDVPLDYVDLYTRHEFGMNYGFGIQVMNVQLGILYRKGFSSLLKEPDPVTGNILHEGVTFSLGILF